MLPDNFDFAMLPADASPSTLKEIGMLESTIETIDYAMVSWIKEDLDLIFIDTTHEANHVLKIIQKV